MFFPGSLSGLVLKGDEEKVDLELHQLIPERTLQKSEEFDYMKYWVDIYCGGVSREGPARNSQRLSALLLYSRRHSCTPSYRFHVAVTIYIRSGIF